jgi:hypothetical protein
MDDIIYYNGRIYLVPESSFKKRVLQAFHDSSLYRTVCRKGLRSLSQGLKPA